MTRAEALKVAKPILFNTEMTLAINNSTKSVTRRVIKDVPNIQDLKPYVIQNEPRGYIASNARVYNFKTPYKVGDILYIRETFCEYIPDDIIDGVKYAYKADTTPSSEEARKELGYKWKPSIHMPKEAARIFLHVTGVRVERLQEMKFKDFIAEGVGLRPEAYNDPDNAYFQAKGQYVTIWNSTIKKSDLDRYGWDANPWVRVTEFEILEVTE